MTRTAKLTTTEAKAGPLSDDEVRVLRAYRGLSGEFSPTAVRWMEEMLTQFPKTAQRPTLRLIEGGK